MSSYIITPSSKIGGKVNISGSKNAALPIMAAALLTDNKTELLNIPVLSDINNMCSVLEFTGAKCHREKNGILSIIPDQKTPVPIDPITASSFRGSFLILGAILSKYQKVKIPMPGGCCIGARPVDLHIKGLTAMGAKVKRGHGYMELTCEKLKGASIYLDFPSVGATENLIMAAARIPEETIIENAATEPEIIDLANFLILCGAEIKGAGTKTIQIVGKKVLKSIRYSIIPDRIEAGTFMLIATACKCPIVIENIISEHLKPVTAKLSEMGICVNELKSQNTTFNISNHSSLKTSSIEILPCNGFKGIDIKTMPYPGFPTDMQAQFTALLSTAKGTSVVAETVFENRFMHIPELIRMGAKIKTEGRIAVIDGVKHLSGATVKATDLRAGASLVIAALAAKEQTEITNIEHIERGYEEFDKKLSRLGVKITKTT